MKKTDKIFVAGHRGMVGSGLTRALQSDGYSNLLLADRNKLDLTDQQAVRSFMNAERPDHVFLAAAKVGGIVANNRYRAEFIYNNLVIQNNVIDSAWRYGVKRLLFLGSSCIYPKHCPQPMKEEHLLTGLLEPTNEPYAIAKIAGIKMCDAYNDQYGTDFISVMPTNLYGPNDNFDLETSHVLPALIRRIHEAKILGAPKVTLWGTGTPMRDFLHVDDMVSACISLMNRDGYREMVNVGSGAEVSIRQLGELICEVVGFQGGIDFDSTKPDGTPRKMLDISRLSQLGWKPTIGLKEGLESTYKWFLSAFANK